MRSCSYRREARTGREGSTPFSKRIELSVLTPSRCDVFRTLMASNVAASMRTCFVCSVAPDFFPQITPAIASISFSSAITISSSLRVYVLPSSASIVSHFFAIRTEIAPSTISASKTCIGCPSSVMTILVKSGRIPWSH